MSRRTYGKYRYLPADHPAVALSRTPRRGGRGGYWALRVEPQVAMRVKRTFGRVSQWRTGDLVFAHTDETARDLEWFIDRYPLAAVDAESEAVLAASAESHRATEDAVHRILTAGAAPTLPHTATMVPRAYQEQAVALLRTTRGLLLTDQVGLGKTATALLNCLHDDALPAVVVAPTHLAAPNGRWVDELTEHFPTLRYHVARKGTPYDIGDVDVLILTYSKLAGWVDHLAGWAKYVIFDEVQDLRRGDETVKGVAAGRLADAVGYKLGLSVGPDSIVELAGGPFGTGWVGPIADATRIAQGVGSLERHGDHEFWRVEGTGIRSRGWTGSGFAWKEVKSFVQHPCTTGVTEVRTSNGPLLLTDEHSVFTVTKDGLMLGRADALAVGDRLALDDGAAWDGATEAPIDVLEVADRFSRAQVVVDTAGVTRRDLGVKPWQWQNFHREAMHGSRLPLDVYRHHKHLLPEPQWVYLSSGRGGRRLRPTIHLSDWAYMLGFFLGDGWLSDGDHRVSFAVEDALVDRFMDYLHHLPGADLTATAADRDGASKEVRFANPLVAAVLRDAGIAVPCHVKAIPGAWITSWPEAARRELLRGLVDSDGHIAKRDGRRHYVTTSRPLATSLLSLLRSLGISAGMSTADAAAGGIVRGRRIVGARTRYNIHWSRYAETGGGTAHAGHRVRHQWGQDALIETPVRAVDPSADVPDVVYDLEMGGHPSFVVNGVLVHNTATPVYNYGGEAWNLLNVLSPGSLGTREEFVREWGASLGNGHVKVKNPAALGAYLREQGVMLGRTRKDVGRELPATLRFVQHVDADPAVLDKAAGDAAAMARLILSETANRQDRWRSAGELDMMMRQATGIAKAPYVAEFVRLLLESEDKIVLFGWHRAVYDLWLERLKDFRPVMYTGTESPGQKGAAVKAFTDPDGPCRVLIMSLRSGSGVDGLQKHARVAVFGELDWSPQVHEQAIGRLERDGMGGEPALAYYLVADEGSDPAIAQVLQVKRQQGEPMVSPDGRLFQHAVGDVNRTKLLAEAALARSERGT